MTSSLNLPDDGPLERPKPNDPADYRGGSWGSTTSQLCKVGLDININFP